MKSPNLLVYGAVQRPRLDTGDLEYDRLEGHILYDLDLPRTPVAGDFLRVAIAASETHGPCTGTVQVKAVEFDTVAGKTWLYSIIAPLPTF